MGLSFLTPLFLAGFLAIAVPVIVHLIRRHRGRTLDFPSLMFLRQMPTKSVKRLRVRDWPLLLLRALALGLIALAFARPVLQLGGSDEGIEGDGLREVVIALDRSWSMMRGDRWDRALSEARGVLNGLVNPDRVSLVLFDASGSIAVEPTLDPARIRAVLDTLQPGWGGTRLGAGIQVAGGILEGSDRSRREVMMISDFQLRGWNDGPTDRLPPGARLIPIDVGDETGTMIVSEVTLEHSFFEGRQRVHPQARVIRSGDDAPTRATLVLEMDGREIESRAVELPTEGAVAVAFEPVTLPEEGVRGAFRLVPDEAPPEEPFRFYFSPAQVLSILLVEGSGNASQNLFLRSALSVGGGQPVSVRTRTGGNVTAADLQGIDLVVFNDVPLPGGDAGTRLRDFVTQGGGLLAIAGPASAPANWEAAWDPVLPGRPGVPVDRDPARGGSLSRIDRDHPIFTPFTSLAGSGLGAARFFRYRALPVPAGAGDDGSPPDDGAPRILAYFDDGSPALAERPVGAGRVLVWTSSMDTGWGDFPLHPIFLPLVREMARHTAAQRETVPYFTVGQPLDATYLLGEAGAPVASLTPGADGSIAARGILVGPGGVGTEMGAGGASLVQPAMPGFYELRLEEQGSGEGRVFAVNPDVGEADPARIDPEALVLAVAPGGGTGQGAETAGGALSGDGQTRAALMQEGERRQGAWRYLLLAALVLLLAEGVLAARSHPLRGPQGQT